MPGARGGKRDYKPKRGGGEIVPLDMIDSQDGVLMRQENHSREICNPSTPVGTADLTTVKD